MLDWLDEIERDYCLDYLAPLPYLKICQMAGTLRELAMFYKPSPKEYEILSSDAKALIDTSRN